ncbi:MAG: RNA methyltransferase [Desulfatibacillaceae bacterium]
MTSAIDRDRIGIILNRPRSPENIGAVARAMRNMGFSRLVVVRPEKCDLYRVCKMATHAGLDVVEEMEVFDDLADALAPFNYVVGTTARTGGHRKSMRDPAMLAGHLIPITAENDVAIMFGPEDKGLSNADVRFCHTLVTIPTHEFSSLNLAQAVMVMCYELYRASTPESPAFMPRLATRQELDGMYEQLSDVLTRIGFINHQNPEHWMDNVRRFLSRLPLTAREVKIVRGVCRQMDWYTEQRFRKMERSED